ncbi:MAG: gliding motility-associated C-terminal domain-containing protein [Saprospiraceae bacterium]|nr:gliding motility-associated C-terminal domain-containing protein [Saprospiraceae bacterium]
MKKSLLLTLLVACFLPFATAQFHFNGSARSLGDRCYQLTPATNGQVGSIWDTTKINLNNSFDANLDLFFGCKDADGADGIVFGFQPINTSIGQQGEGMGFLGVSPSIGIEMDTYQNSNRGDPSYDHIAIIKNGDITHGSGNTLAGPVSIGSGGNVEDCQKHSLRVKWDAVAKKLQVWFDCELKLTYTGDIVNDIFGGNPLVFWGFTAATGGANNEQNVCFKFTTLIDKPTKANLCKGDTVQLNAYGGVTYRWSPTTGLSNPNIANPIAKPDVTTTYTVAVGDRCGVEFNQEVTLVVNGDPILIELGPDRTLCVGETARLDASGSGARTYKWSNNATDSIIFVQKDGLYKVQAARGNCTATDSVLLHFIIPPSVKLGNDTVLCENKKLILLTWAEAATYKWQDGSTLPSFPVAYTGIYTVTVSNKCGRDSGSVKVTYDDCHKVYIPTAFSPNDDNINDALVIYDHGNVRRVKSFRIYDRWGSLVFEKFDFTPNDPAFGWNGKYNNSLLQSAVYVYVAEIEFTDGETLVKKGDVTLMR